MSEETTETPRARHDVVAFILVGLLGLALLAFAIGALFLPPGISFVLVRRGLGEDHPSWVVLGALTGSMWLAMLVVTARRLLGRQRSVP